MLQTKEDQICRIPGCQNAIAYITTSKRKSKLYCLDHSLNGVEVKCHDCGKISIATPQNYMKSVRSGRSIHRCRKCSMIHYNKSKEGREMASRRQKQTFKNGFRSVCKNCNKKYIANTTNRIYCEDCAHVTKICDHCGKEYEILRRRDKGTVGFCSLTCATRHIHITRRNEDPEKYFMYQTLASKAVKNRFNPNKALQYWKNKSINEKIQYLKDLELERKDSLQKFYIRNSRIILEMKRDGVFSKTFSDDILKEIEEADDTDFWVYGHVYNDVLYYIGQTTRDPIQRYSEHLYMRRLGLNGLDDRFSSAEHYSSITGITEDVLNNTKVVSLAKIERNGMSEEEHRNILNLVEDLLIKVYEPHLNFIGYRDGIYD